MTYAEYIAYHKRGDAGAEERMIASLSSHLRLSEWDRFRLIYYYTMTYHIPSALRLLTRKDTKQSDLVFRTDRRYVRCNGAYDRLLAELNRNKLADLQRCKTTQEAYDTVRGWFFFGRYAAFLFLEVYYHCFRPKWQDNVRYKWEADENYTKGAVSIIGTSNPTALDEFLDRAKRDTGDNAFAIETSLCAVAKFSKGTRWDGFYTERMLAEADKSKEYGQLIYQCL